MTLCLSFSRVKQVKYETYWKGAVVAQFYWPNKIVDAITQQQ